MAEIKEAGYIRLREHIVDDYTRIKLKDENGDVVLTLSVDDDNVNWTHETGEKEIIVDVDTLGRPIYETVPVQDNPNLELTIQITGEDVTQPTTIASVDILRVWQGFDTEEEESVSEEFFDPFTIENVGDELTIVHTIQVPQP